MLHWIRILIFRKRFMHERLHKKESQTELLESEAIDG